MSQLLTLYTLVVYLYLDRFRLWLERRRVARVLRRRPAAESDALRVVGPRSLPSAGRRVRCLTMQTRLSSKGQVVLPSPIRRKLGLVPGDSLRVEIDRDRVVLTPRREGRPSSRLSTSARTGLPVLKPATKAPPVTSDLVARLLEELP